MNMEVNMKRFLIILTAILSISVLSLTNVKAATLPKVTSHDKVTIYIFRGHGCSHCYGLINYLYNNMSKYTDYINVVAYEVENENGELVYVVNALERPYGFTVPSWKDSYKVYAVSAAQGRIEVTFNK